MPVTRSNGHAETNGQCKVCCRNSSVVHRVLKVFLTAVVVFFIFVVGMGFGFKIGYFGMRSVQYVKTNPTALNMMKKYDRDDRKDFLKGNLVAQSRLFGTITQIEGNKITVTNNAAQETVVLSQVTTVIVLGETEVGVASLKVGMNLVSTGVFNKDNQLEAQIIKIL